MYRIVLAEKARTPISMACELLGVSRSGYYEGASPAPSDRDLSDAWLIERIKEIHAGDRGVYGSRRVTAELRLGEGIVVSRKRVQRLMHQAGLSGLVKVKRVLDVELARPMSTSCHTSIMAVGAASASHRRSGRAAGEPGPRSTVIIHASIAERR